MVMEIRLRASMPAWISSGISRRDPIMPANQFLRRVVKPCVAVAALMPAGYLAWAVITGNLSANPLADITNETGDWALRFLCITLAITPLRRISGWNGAIKLRRMLGLFAFFYGGLHFLTSSSWIGLHPIFSSQTALMAPCALAAAVSRDIYQRPLCRRGLHRFVKHDPACGTSTTGMIRRRLAAVALASTSPAYVCKSCTQPFLHYWWLSQARDVRRPVAHGVP